MLFLFFFFFHLFRIDWFDLLAVQGTLKSLLQHHRSKASILQHSAFFMVELSHPYLTTGKIIPLTRWTLLAKECLCFLIMLSRFVIAFLPRSKRLLILWLQSLSAVIVESKKIVCHCFVVSQSTWHEVMGLDVMILVFFECWVLSQIFHFPLSPSSRGSLVPLCFLQ